MQVVQNLSDGDLTFDKNYCNLIIILAYLNPIVNLKKNMRLCDADR